MNFRLFVAVFLATGSAVAAPPFPNVPLPMPVTTNAKSVPMPLVGKSGIKDAPRKQNVVHLADGVNEIVFVSSSLPNRIATPFAAPTVVGADEDINYQVVGQDVFFVPGKLTPVGVFIMDANRTNGPVASLTLLPQNIPGQNIVLVLDQLSVRSGGIAEKDKTVPDVASDYVDGLSSIVRQVAMGGAPSGFAEARIDVGLIKLGSLTIIPERQYTGQSLTVYRYRVENSSKDPVELSEPAFFEQGVRAVAFWPNVRLDPRMSTSVIVVAEQPSANEVP